MRKKRVVLTGLQVASYLFFAGTILSAYGGYLDPHRWTVPSIGLLFFPYLAIITLIISASWLIARRYIPGCIGVAALIACGPTFSEAVPFRFSNEATDSTRTFKLVTFNCLHLRDIKDKSDETNRSLSFLINSGADFICLQELYGFGTAEVPAKYQPQLDSLFRIYPYRSQDGWREVEFLSKYPFEQPEIQLDYQMKYGSFAVYEINLFDRDLTIVNVHLPSYMLSEDERKIITEFTNEKGAKASIREFEGTVYQKMHDAFIMRADVSKEIAEKAAEFKGSVIVCGDFNDVPGSWTYRNFIKRGFADAYATTGMGHVITYNQHLMLFHIDQILYKGDLVPLWVKKSRHDASDHYPLEAEFEFL